MPEIFCPKSTEASKQLFSRVYYCRPNRTGFGFPSASIENPRERAEANIFHFHITTTKRPCLSPLGLLLLLPSFCDVHRRPQGPTEKYVPPLYKFTKPLGERLLSALAAAYAADRPGAWQRQRHPILSEFLMRSVRPSRRRPPTDHHSWSLCSSCRSAKQKQSTVPRGTKKWLVVVHVHG